MSLHSASASDAPLPRRHPDRPVEVPGGIRLISALLGVRDPDADEFRRLGELLTAGDPPMDDLVDWMLSAGMATSRPLFEQALAEGIASVPEAPVELRAFFDLVEQVPDWVDPAAVRRGAAAMRSSGADGLYIARDAALLGGYQYSGFNQTLLRTGALEKGSNTRFAETAQWALDVISPGGLDPLGVGYRSTIRVRFIHSMVRRHVSAMPDWDVEQWGLPINQTDMAATLVGALVAPSAGGLVLGLVNKPQEYAGIAQLTRYVGWLMGVHPDYLPLDFRDAVRVLRHTGAALATPDETSRQLATPMIDDPLQWRYPRLQGLRRRIAREQHLSLSSVLLGRQAMAALGLPWRPVPWYVALRLPVNGVRSMRAWLPGGRARAAERGFRDAQAFMRIMTAAPATIGQTTTVAGHAA